MRINRNMLLKLADDTVTRYVGSDRTIMAIYLQGSLLGDSPLLGNTADIDLFMVHSDEVQAEREIIRLSDEVHLDIAHHPHSQYRQPRELRVNPWLGPVIYGCKILYDPQHFIDFVQASVRGQFNNPINVMARTQQQASHAREMWKSFSENQRVPSTQDASLYLRALEHVADAIAGLHGQNLTERRFLSELSRHVELMNKPGLYKGFLGLLGAPAVEPKQISSWLPAWKTAYNVLGQGEAPAHLHPHRLLYYERGIEAILAGEAPPDALWPLWHTWTGIICTLPEDSPLREDWQQAGNQLGLLGEVFKGKIEALDAYLDQVEELLEDWGRRNGV